MSKYYPTHTACGKIIGSGHDSEQAVRDAFDEADSNMCPNCFEYIDSGFAVRRVSESPVKPDYHDYCIAMHCSLIQEPLKGRGQCRRRSEEMVAQYPELRLAAGFYHCPLWGRQAHWWCVAPDGEVWDPTSCQFPSYGEADYEEVAPEDRPLGKCMECGEMVFKDYIDDDGEMRKNTSAPTFCAPMCEEATRRAFGW